MRGRTRPPALRCAAVEPAAGPIQSAARLLLLDDRVALRALHAEDVARRAGGRLVAEERLVEHALVHEATVALDAHARELDRRQLAARSRRASASSTRPFCAPQKKPTESVGALLMPEDGRLGR